MGVNKTNINRVRELILDEHKLVTYISLSKELCIHVNEAKTLLREVIQDIRKINPETDLSISYVIAGLLNNDNGCVTVCPEPDLDSLRKSLKMIFYEHVYCVSRGLQAAEIVALSAVSKFEDISLCTGLIKANSCSKRTDDEIGSLKSINQAVLNASKPSNIQQSSKDKVNKEVRSTVEVKVEPEVKSEKTSPKKNSPTKKTLAKLNGNKSGPGGIAGFFSKVNGDSSKNKKAKVSEPEIKKEKEDKVEPVKKDTDVPSNTIANGSAESIKTKSNNKNNISIKKNAKVDKKRKRLLHVSDSESDNEGDDPFAKEMDVDHESEDEIPPTPTINTVKITSGIINPKKRRKIVDKTYTDEDGYILTKKEEVYESCSENEEEEIKENQKIEKNNTSPLKTINTGQVKPVKNEPTIKKETKSKKKLSPPKKGKQATINSFFKKV
ncbi:DNA polymerase delta subunit 3-like [Spodoptera litura]|uniref:DNA polymerase delta subunit 3 n=1 Tax=Spodoptera litura TaxID=69820 RepID=A0A9J7ECD1_SPOLT|nr:DNA polymerase delta subunit 3-like [Spodoptera litura]